VLPIVAVELTTTEASPALERSLLAACSAGLRRAECVPAGGATDKPAAVAMVSWSDPAHARVEVGVERPEGAEWRARELEFSPQDPADERWRAVGFTIALLVGEKTFADAAPAEAAPAAGAFCSIDLKALTGTGLSDDGWRFGAELRVLLSVPSTPWFVGAAAHYARAPEPEPGVQLRWLDLALGGGLQTHALFPGVGGRARLELLLENVAASAERDGASASRAAWVPGLRLGGDVVWPSLGQWAVVGSADAFWLDGSTPVTIGGTQVAESAAAGVTFSLGVEARL
jgi:hypothetical protein